MDNKTLESYLTFKLEGELFAISVHKVLEIIETGDEHNITHLPKAPEAISGVVNFRGNVIPVVDTRMKFDLPTYEEKQKFVIMVLNLTLNNNEHFVGAMADKVVDVIEINEQEIKPVPEVGQGYNSEYIRGVIHREGQFIMLLDLDRAMGTDEIVHLKEQIAEGEEEEQDAETAGTVE
jgi:purine-binding chemotaxis protein CheW